MIAYPKQYNLLYRQHAVVFPIAVGKFFVNLVHLHIFNETSRNSAVEMLVPLLPIPPENKKLIKFLII